MPGKVSVFYHPDLRSCGEVDRGMIEAFVNHCKHFDRDSLLAEDCHKLLDHRHEYFPHIQEMFLDVTRNLVHITQGHVDTGNLFTYLSETRSTVKAVELEVSSDTMSRLVVPLYVISSVFPEITASSTSQAMSLVLNDSRDRLDSILFDQVENLGADVKVCRVREVVRFHRNSFWREWIALIRILEGDPVLDYPRQTYRREKPVKLEEISRSEIPANLNVFKVAKKVCSFHAEKVEDIDKHLQRLFRISAARKFH